MSEELVVYNVDLIKTDNKVKEAAITLADMEETYKAMGEEIARRKEAMLESMNALDLKQIRFQSGYKILVVQKSNVKVDKKKALIFLDSIGQTELFQKLDETKLKEVYFDKDSNSKYDFIIEGEPSSYLKISKEK
jgi:hypothetical protein